MNDTEASRLDRLEAKVDSISIAATASAAAAAAAVTANVTSLSALSKDVLEVKLAFAEYRGARRVVNFIATAAGAVLGALAAFFAVSKRQ